MANVFQFQNDKIAAENLVTYDVRNAPFQLYGFYKPEERGVFKRIPLDVAEKTSKNVRLLCTNTAGGRLRFKTDSSYIAVGAIYPHMEFPSPCSTALGKSVEFYGQRILCKMEALIIL